MPWTELLFLSSVMKFGLSCSLFDVVDGKGKPSRGNLAALVNKLERDRMVSYLHIFSSPKRLNVNLFDVD